jgi:hypothetical protein
MLTLWVGAFCAFIWLTLFTYFCLSALVDLRKEVLKLKELLLQQQ